jgi:uncharacterized membrane protein (DUF2068 family)
MHNPLRRPELVVCAWRGHVTPGAEIAVLDARHASLGRVTADGRRFVQCLRCGSWLLVDGPAADEGTTVDSLDAIERPRQGKALRQAIILRVIAVDRMFHTVAFTGVAIAALVLHANFKALHSWASGMLDALSSARAGSGGVSSHGLTAALLTRLSHINPHSLLWLAALGGAYALVSAFEAYGLWNERRWAEYLTVLATAGFLPLEIHELIERVTFVRVFALVINLAILVYLVVAKHLFGIGGPLKHEPAPELQPLPELVAMSPATDPG